MSSPRPATVRARFQPCEGEVYEVAIVMHAPFPCAIDEAASTVQRMLDHMIDHAAGVFSAEADTET